MSTRTIVLFLTLAGCAFSQTARRSVVTASGEGVVSVKPDQARVTVSVQTRAATAQQAADQNAQQTTAVLDQLRQLLGQAADLRTAGYNVYPEYSNARVVTSYMATNSVTVTLNDINLVSRVLDGSTQSGATSIGGVQFLLKDYGPSRLQALRQAAQQARANAEAIASGLSMSIGAITAASDTYAVRTISPVDTRTAAPGAGSGVATPIEAGMIEVRATVSVEAELR